APGQARGLRDQRHPAMRQRLRFRRRPEPPPPFVQHPPQRLAFLANPPYESLLSHAKSLSHLSNMYKLFVRRTLLALSRGHWTIENRLHWVRDVTFDEDRSRVRKGAGAQVMASLRNLAISLLRLAGARYIAPALRRCARSDSHALRLIGLRL